MRTKMFKVSWRLSPDCISQSKKVDFLGEAIEMKLKRKEEGYQVKIEVTGNDF